MQRLPRFSYLPSEFVDFEFTVGSNGQKERQLREGEGYPHGDTFLVEIEQTQQAARRAFERKDGAEMERQFARAADLRTKRDDYRRHYYGHQS